MNVKKQYIEIAKLLEENKNRKVSTILPELMKLMQSKVNSSTVRRDAEGNVVAIFCYYHKKWEEVSECEYGAKKNTSSGLNTMCKEGVANWTKQQRVARKANDQLLDMLSEDELTAEELPDFRADIEARRTVIIPRLDEQGEDE